jgi:general stress protein 26
MKKSLIEAKEYLDTIRIPMRIAIKTEDKWPWVISLWFLHQDGLLYCATQKHAKIVGHLENDNRCAFEIAADTPPYCGIRGKARARIDESLGAKILEKLLVRYLGGTNNELAQNLLAKRDSEVSIVLEPLRVYTWDFRERMEGIKFEQSSSKVCP